MKKFIGGLVIGLLLASSVMVFASGQAIKLIVNGNEVFSDVPPQIIDGRTMVPARPLAEALGAKVEWDGVNNAVVVTKQETSNDISKANVSVKAPEFYYSAREIMNVIWKKYPNLKQASGNINIEPKKGEIRFIWDTGALWIDGKRFDLPSLLIDDFLYFSIEPLLEAKIVNLIDF